MAASAATGSRAILLIWDSGSKDKTVLTSHQAMAEELKRLRGQGVLAKVPELDQSIKVYDFGLSNHAASLKALGVGRAEAPAIAAVSLDGQGLPKKVLYVTHYGSTSAGLAGLGKFLGTRLESDPTRPGGQEERRVVFLTDTQNQGPAGEKLQQHVSSHFKDLASVRDLGRKPYTYSFAKDDHRAFLERLGLERAKAPYLTVIRFVGETPRDVLWSAPVVDPDISWQAMCDYLGMKTGVAIDKTIYLVGRPGKEQEGSFYELQGKLTAVLNERPPRGVQPGLQIVETLAGVNAPALVMSTASTGTRLVVDSSFRSSEEMVDGLYKALGQVYQAPVEYINPKDGSTLRRVAGGIYKIGREDGDENEKPVHSVEMGPFYMSKYEVTNQQFARFAEATQYVTVAERQGASYAPKGDRFSLQQGANWKHPSGPGSSPDPRAPVVHLTHDDALAYAAWAGLSLPFEEQWEWAARGPDQRQYPWGNEFAENVCRGSVGRGFAGAQTPSPVGSYAKDQSSFGCFDMGGNVAEWTVNYYKVYPGSQAARDKCNELYVTVRGGSWANELAREFRASKRIPMARAMSFSTLGFRVARTERRRLSGP